jgi:hypothetical protein
LNLPSHTALLEQPTLFPTVTPFKGYTPHAALASPTDHWQALIFDILALHVCSHASFAPPAIDTPLGYIIYTFRPSIRQTFLKHNLLVHNVFEGSLIIADVTTFWTAVIFTFTASFASIIVRSTSQIRLSISRTLSPDTPTCSATV